MEKTAKIYIDGHGGMVGSAIEQKFRNEGFNNIITQASNKLDLRNQQAVNVFFEKEKPEYVILAAAKVGGINANNCRIFAKNNIDLIAVISFVWEHSSGAKEALEELNFNLKSP